MKNEVEQLEDYVSLPEAAELLGISRQAIHELANRGTFQTMKQIGNRFYVVRRSELHAYQTRKFVRLGVSPLTEQ